MMLDYVDIIARKELQQKLAALEISGGSAPFSSKLSVTEHRADAQGQKKEEEDVIKYDPKILFNQQV
jgi:hypothetical protein